MRGVFLHFSIIALALVAFSNSQRSFGSGGSRASSSRIGYLQGNLGSYPSAPVPTATASTRVQKTAGGIGAWGYVAILLTIILSGMGAYYFILFYPIVCKKERMYDVMEMTTV